MISSLGRKEGVAPLGLVIIITVCGGARYQPGHSRSGGDRQLACSLQCALCSLCAWEPDYREPVTQWTGDRITSSHLSSLRPPHHDHQPQPPRGAGPLHHGTGRGHQQAVHHLQREDPGCVLLSSGEANSRPNLSSNTRLLYRRSRSPSTECWSSLSP